VKNLLNFSRRSSIESAEKINTSINEVIRKILSLVQHDFEMKGVRVHLDLDSKVPPAYVNENEIAQVILNLANNAADSMPAGGDLHVSTRYDEIAARLCITVHDTGCGIKAFGRAFSNPSSPPRKSARALVSVFLSATISSRTTLVQSTSIAL
jgi:signal transduction histidine kinase